MSVTHDFFTFFFTFTRILPFFLSIFWWCWFYLSVALLNFIDFCFHFYCFFTFFQNFIFAFSSFPRQKFQFLTLDCSCLADEFRSRSSPAFAAPHQCFHLIFLCLLISQCVSLTLESSSWSHVVLRTALFNFQVFGGFPLLSLMLISSWTSLLGE